MNNMLKNLVIWLVIGLVLMTVFNQFNTRQSAQAPMEYSQFLEEVKAGKISKVTIEGRQLKATTAEGKRVTSYSPGDIWLVSDLLKYGVKIEAKPEEEPSLLMNIFVSWFPMLLLIGVWIFFMRQMQGGGRGGAFSFGKSRARMLDESTNTVTFADVAGCEEAKEEVAELVDFLRDPSKFQKLGGRIPRGVLMVGAPGTGKTLLARAISVLPVPGGPTSSTPRGMRPPRRWNFCGSRRNSTISWRSSFASSTPATSSNVTRPCASVSIFARDLPKPIALPPAPCIWRERKIHTPINAMNGSHETSSETNHGTCSPCGFAVIATPLPCSRWISDGSVGA